jgi:hypothetical protein
MVEGLSNLLIVLIVIGVIWWIGTEILKHVPAPIPLRLIWDVVLALIFLIILVKFVLVPVLSGHPML